MNTWSQNAKSAKTLRRRTSLKSFKEFGQVKHVAAPCFRQAGVVISPFICINALGKS